MHALLPDPWDESRVEELFTVSRLGVLVSGRVPEERGMVASWLALTGSEMTLDPLLDAVRFAADWAGGPDAATVEAHFASEAGD